MLDWMTDEYLVSPPVRLARKPLANERTDGCYLCCGGYREHFDFCNELCCICGQQRTTSGWNSTWANGPNGFPAHPGCLEDRAWEDYRDRPHADEPIDVDDDVGRPTFFDQDAL